MTSLPQLRSEVAAYRTRLAQAELALRLLFAGRRVA